MKTNTHLEHKGTYLSCRLEIFGKFPMIPTSVVPVEHHAALQKWILESCQAMEQEAINYADKNAGK